MMSLIHFWMWIRGSVYAESVDGSHPAAVAAGHERAVAQHGPVDILVTSAGVSHPGRFLDLDDQVFRDMIEIDYFGTLHPIRAVTPGMVQRGRGSIVGISSACALLGVYGYTAVSYTHLDVYKRQTSASRPAPTKT